MIGLLRGRKLDLLILVLWPPLVAILALLIGPGVNAMHSVLLFFGVPALFLSFRQPQQIKKAALFSLFGLPIIIVIDYISHATNSWIIPHSILTFKIFEFVTLEVILWMMAEIYLVILFYEYFVVHHVKEKLWYPRIRYFVYFCMGLFAVFLWLFFSDSDFLLVPYWYLIFGVTMILIPALIETFTFPRVSVRIFSVVPYFIYLTLIYEIIALKIGWWSFPGKEFVGWVSFFGVRFPLEELLFWIILLPAAILSYYEFYAENERG